MEEWAYPGIDELDTEDVWQEEDDFVLWIVASWGGDVARDISDRLEFSCGDEKVRGGEFKG